MSQFQVDEVNSDEEHLFIDIAGKGTVVVVSNDIGVLVDIYSAHVSDAPIGGTYVLDEDFYKEKP